MVACYRCGYWLKFDMDVIRYSILVAANYSLSVIHE